MKLEIDPEACDQGPNLRRRYLECTALESQRMREAGKNNQDAVIESELICPGLVQGKCGLRVILPSIEGVESPDGFLQIH